MKIRSLQKVSFDRIFKAFRSAFEDYEVQLNKNQLKDMLKRRGFVSSLSFAAFEGEDIVSFTLNGIGVFNGQKAAYDIGTGTIKEFRKKGLVSEIFNYSLPFLKEAVIQTYILEVLQHNSKAISAYQNIGFKVSREFNYYIQKNEEVRLENPILDSSYRIQQIKLPPGNLITKFWDFTPSWQNSLISIKREPNNFKVFGVFMKQKLIGYSVLEPNSGDLAQIAVDSEFRRKGIASYMLKEILQYNKHHSIKILNIQADCKSISDFLKSIDVLLAGKQFEMLKQL